MSSTEQPGTGSLTHDRHRELKGDNYLGNVSNQFSKMHPAECLNNAVVVPSKLPDSNGTLQQKIVNKENNCIETNGQLAATLPYTSTSLTDVKKYGSNVLLLQDENGGLKSFQAPPVVDGNVNNEDLKQELKNEHHSYIIPPTKVNNGTSIEFAPKINDLNRLNQQNDTSYLDLPTSNQKDVNKPLMKDCGIGSLKEVNDIAANVIEEQVRENSKELNNEDPKHEESKQINGEDGKSIASSRNSLHVQFEESSHENPLDSEPQIARESPVYSVTSDSSSEDDESSLEDLNEGRAPDGGYGWVVVAAAFFTNLIADGITFTFGIIYVELLKHFKEGKSKTAWIGGIFMAMPLLSGPVASYLCDRFGCRKVCMSGAVLACFGFVISSQANSIEVLILTFGIISGFGLAMCFVSAVVIVSYYFDKRRSLATGLSVCGSGLGTFIFAPVSSKLIQEYGWRGTTLILAGLFLNITVCGALMRDLEWTKEKKKAQRRDRKMKHRNKRSLKSQSQSLRTATSSVGSLNPSKTLSIEELKWLLQNGDTPIPTVGETPEANEEFSRLCNSVLHLPTFVRNGEKVPLEVLELLSSNQHVYNIVLKNYPSLLIQSRSNSDAGQLHESPERIITVKTEPLLNNNEHSNRDLESPSDNGYGQPLRSDTIILNNDSLPQSNVSSRQLSSGRQLMGARGLPAVYLRHTHLPRRSLTYRGAMLNVKRYRTRAASCPDISRNPMIITPQKTTQWYECFWDLRDVLADMVDISHFSNVRFLLFAVSNFILYSWYHVPYVFIADKTVEMGFSEGDASLLISILGILNTFGEILLGWMGDLPWVNAGVIYALCMGACGIVTIVVPLLTSYTSLCIASGGFGLSIAANYSLASIILVELISLDRFTNAYGLLLFVQGTANLVGPPIAGWLYDVTGDYDLSFYLAGFFIILCGILLVILPTMKWWKRRKRQSQRGSRDIPPIKDSRASKKDVLLAGESEILPV